MSLKTTTRKQKLQSFSCSKVTAIKLQIPTWWFSLSKLFVVHLFTLWRISDYTSCIRTAPYVRELMKNSFHERIYTEKKYLFISYKYNYPTGCYSELNKWGDRMRCQLKQNLKQGPSERYAGGKTGLLCVWREENHGKLLDYGYGCFRCSDGKIWCICKKVILEGYNEFSESGNPLGMVSRLYDNDCKHLERLGWKYAFGSFNMWMEFESLKNEWDFYFFKCEYVQ